MPDASPGKWKDYWKFFGEVNTFIEAHDADFTTDQVKILFILSLMKEGLAGEWAENFYEDEYN
jgi:hypothetical protein